MRPNPEPLSRRASNIFINYRREDSAGHAGRLSDHLSGRFPGRVFMDIDTIEPGIDFMDVINHAVGTCEVLIVVIGRDWLFLTDATGQRRLDNPSDFVRLEIAAALQRNIRIIPVLVEGASMPRMEDLPPDLASLTRRNAIELSDARFTFDVDRLIQTIEGVLQDRAPSAIVKAMTLLPQPAPAPVRKTSGSRSWLAAAAVALLILAGWLGGSLGLQPGSPVDVNPISPELSMDSPAVLEPVPEPKPSLEEKAARTSVDSGADGQKSPTVDKGKKKNVGLRAYRATRNFIKKKVGRD